MIAGFGLRQSANDPCVFYRNTQSTGTNILGIYVDDGVVASSDPAEVEQLLNYLNDQFEITTSTGGQFLEMKVQVERSGDIVLSHYS